MTLDYSGDLHTLAITEVPGPVYPEPTPTLEAEIAAKREEWQQVHAGALPRSKHDQIMGELQSLVAQNDVIVAGNQAARDVVDDAYEAAITAFKADADNIERAAWITIGRERFRILRATDYILCEDVEMPAGTTKQQWKDYRSAVRAIKQAAYNNSSEVIWPEPPA